MAESKIVQAILSGLSAGDPATLATPNETARIDVNCDGPKERNPVGGLFSVLFPKNTTKIIPSGGCVVKYISTLDPDQNDPVVSGPVSVFKTELSKSLRSLSQSNKNIVYIKKEISRILYETFVSDAISNKTVPRLSNLYLYNYRTEGIFGRPIELPGEDEVNFNFKKISDFFFIPSDALYSIIDILKKDEDDPLGVWIQVFSGISGIAIDFSSFSNQKNEDNLTKLIIEFLPFFNYTDNEIRGQDAANSSTLDYRYHGGYYTIDGTSIIAKLPDISGRNYRGNSSYFYEEFESKIIMQLHSIKEGVDNYKNIILDFDLPFNGEINGYNSSFELGQSTEDFEIELTGFNIDSTTITPYLSLVFENDNFSNEPQGYGDIKHRFVDYFICPNTEKFIDENKLKEKKSILETSSDLIRIQSSVGEILGKQGQISLSSSGMPTNLYDRTRYRCNKNEVFSFFSRQDELLASNQEDWPLGISIRRPGITKNWFSSKAMNSSSFGIQTTPRIYGEHLIPESWIKGRISSGQDDSYIISFNSSDINKINANRVVFSLYLSNGKGQIYRVSNQPIIIERSPPEILAVSPDGFKEGGISLTNGNDLFIDGSGFLDNCTVTISGIVATIKNRRKNKLTVVVPDGVSGAVDLIVSNGKDSNDTVKIYISANADIPISLLPSRAPQSLRVFGNSVVAKNIGEIPLSYDAPNSSIEIKTKKLTFFDSIVSTINAFLYIKTPNKNIVDFISNDYFKIDSDTYILNDIRWNMGEGTDFAKKSLRSASLKLPGSGNIRGPIESLIYLKNDEQTDVGIYIINKDSANLITSQNSLKASFKLGTLPFFSATPAILGMAGSTEDFGDLEAYRNFDFGIFSENTRAIENVILSELFSSGSSSNLNKLKYGPIKSLYSVKNLVVFFKSITSDYPQKYTFYIAGKKVSIFDTKNVEKVYDSNSGYSVFRATLSSVDTENLFAGVGSVIIKRKDRKRRVELSSENIYVEFSSSNELEPVEQQTSGREQIYVLKEDLVLAPQGTQLKAINPFAGTDIFKIGTIDSSLFGNIIRQDSNKPVELIDFNSEISVLLNPENRQSSSVFSPITIQSPYSSAELFFSEGYESFLQTKEITDIKNNVEVSFSPTELKYLPSSIAIRKGTVINQFHKANIGDYSEKIKTFHRFRITNYATVLSNQPRILNVIPSSFSGGDTVTIVVEKINVKKIKIYVNTTRAKIVGNPKDNEITIIAPNDVDNIRLLDGKCQEIIIKPTKRTLLGAEGDLGLTFVNEALRAIADSINGFLKDKMGDVQDLIDRIKQKFLSFINLKLDKVNIAKELINSFCDMSFHLTAELNIYLKNFSILLIPVKVIFCIIDVICSLLNPAELAPAIVRLFECLYDLLLLLPPLAIPVLVLNLFLHLLELLECVITKIINTIAIVTIVIQAINETSALISGDEEVDFKYLMMLEGILLDNFLTIDADLQVLGPIVQILAIILQLLQLAFRFPCKIGPQTAEPDCGIDGTMLAGFLISTIQSEDGTLKTEYLLPVAQNKPKSSAILEDSSDENITIAEIRSSLVIGADDIDSPVASSVAIEKTSDETFIEAINYNEENFRFNSNNNVCFVASATKAVKKLSTPQKIKFLFKGVANQSLFRRRVDFNSPIDSPVTLLNKINDNKINISPATGSANRNFYSMMDGEAFINVKNEDGKIVGDVKPLTLPIEINLVTHLRTFVGIPKMILMDEKSNFYIIDNNGISFDDDLNIEAISASIINTNSAPDIDYSRDSQDITNDDGDPESVTIFRFPKLYFVDVRAAAEIIQQQCSQFSINNFLFELSDVDETTRIVQEANDCLNGFIDGISIKVQEMRAETNRGLIPTPFPENFAENLGQELIACINRGLNDICPQVVNPLNTSFKILEDKDETPLGGFPNLVLSDDIMQGFQTDGPPLTGAREYAAGVGDSATIKVDKEATLEITPRDSYDEIIISAYDISDKIDIQIISDETGTARIVKKQYNNKLKNVIPDGLGKYYSYITASKPGIVRVRAKICSKAIQAITYAGLEDIVTGNIKSEIDCVPETAASAEEDRIIPLGAQVRVDRILTITFEERVESDIQTFISTKQDSDASPTQSGIFASGAE